MNISGRRFVLVNKQSLKFLDRHEQLQGEVTNSAFLFAQMTMAEAKKNSLTREQVIKEGSKKRSR